LAARKRRDARRHGIDGVYWKPVWNILEGQFEILLVNAQHIKAVPGRKTDQKDSEYRQTGAPDVCERYAARDAPPAIASLDVAGASRGLAVQTSLYAIAGDYSLWLPFRRLWHGARTSLLPGTRPIAVRPSKLNPWNLDRHQQSEGKTLPW
jgi:hypothetical protein